MKQFTASLLLMLIIVSCHKQTVEPDADIQIDAGVVTGEINPIWHFFGYDEANYTYHPEGEKLLKAIGELSDNPIYIRCHHLLTTGNADPWLKWSSTNAYTEDRYGQPVYNWTIIDSIFDTYLKHGLKPYVQAGFMPEALSSRPDPYTPEKVLHDRPQGMVSGGAFYPPKDYDKWYTFIKAWATHCKERYGEEEVSSWYWEPWNEPNIGYWKGTDEEFLKLYDYTTEAIKSILPEAKVGGPHIASPGFRNGVEFLTLFLDHVYYGTNYKTGETGSILDFVAVHAKGGTSWQETYAQMNAGNHLRHIDLAAEIIARYPGAKDLPLIIGESDPDGCAGCTSRLFPQNRYRNSAHYAAYTAATFMRKQDVAARYGINLTGALTWAFTFPDQPWFDGFRSLSTNGVAKPVFNTFRMFSMLNSDRLNLFSNGSSPVDSIIQNGITVKPDINGIASKSDTSITLLVWNYFDKGIDTVSSRVRIQLNNMPEGFKNVTIAHYRIDEHHSNAYTTWKSLGSPQNPDAEQLKKIASASELALYEPLKTVAVKRGTLTLKTEMPCQSVSLFKLTKIE